MLTISDGAAARLSFPKGTKSGSLFTHSQLFIIMNRIKLIVFGGAQLGLLQIARILPQTE